MSWWARPSRMPAALAALACAACAACGDGLALPDAAAPPDTDAGLVRVQLVSDLGPPVGQEVYFQDADSTTVLATRTGTDGTASAWMRPGGSVTVIERRGSAFLLHTFVDVRPGAPMTINARPPPDDDVRGFSLRLPGLPGASRALLWLPCGGPLDVPISITPYDLSIVCDARSDALVTAAAQDAHYLHVEDVALTGDVPLPQVWRPAGAARVALAGARPAASLYAVEQTLVAGGRPFGPRPGGPVPLTGGAGEAALDPAFMPLPPEATLATRATEVLDAGTPSRPEQVLDWRPAGEPVALDVAATRLVELEVAPRIEANRLRWTERGDGHRPDGVIVTLTWELRAQGVQVTWRVLAPRGDAPELPLPILPRADLRIPAALTLAQLVAFRITGGFDRVRGFLPRDATDLTWAIHGERGAAVLREARGL